MMGSSPRHRRALTRFGCSPGRRAGERLGNRLGNARQPFHARRYPAAGRRALQCAIVNRTRERISRTAREAMPVPAETSLATRPIGARRASRSGRTGSADSACRSKRACHLIEVLPRARLTTTARPGGGGPLRQRLLRDAGGSARRSRPGPDVALCSILGKAGPAAIGDPSQVPRGTSGQTMDFGGRTSSGPVRNARRHEVPPAGGVSILGWMVPGG